LFRPADLKKSFEQTKYKEKKMSDLTQLESSRVVDARGSACPGPLLEAKKGIGTIAVGEVLEIWSGDANTKNDIPKWCKKVGHEFIGSLEADGYDRLFIKRLK
jgi:TusA-related sulfurtransferase